ncbi:hypothetical protein MYSTI_01526 [Myxococcus stipitatus DSM 14675]|uniref:Serine protease n=1 Tax=Myxococcus stipitatus (strain DSM 14675 / JCM 12634 / Mx s8) TaxID=1278073 RepID=L7U250_MYXSD|nr:hypothetical protein [Myxococcus stipitatus]AGC42866.1 hypothetical protein MYSTI_01526 [Myxococcus stipitatus DSM 14675]
MAGRRKRTLEQIVRSLARARQRVAEDLDDLARLSRPSDNAVVFEQGSAWMHRILHKRRPELSPTNILALGLGTKVTRNKDTGRPAALVLVPRKLSSRELARQSIEPVRKYVEYGGRKLAVDVREVGAVRRQLRPGSSVGPADGLATLGAFARDRQKLVAITAMHVTGLTEFSEGDSEAPIFYSPSPMVDRASARIGQLLRGTMTDIDAAKVSVDAPQAVLPSAEARGARYLLYPSDLGTFVQMRGAMTTLATGYIQNLILDFPKEGLTGCFTVSMETQPGDSGAGILDWKGLVVGFLVGRVTVDGVDLALGTPAMRVLYKLGCTIAKR